MSDYVAGTYQCQTSDTDKGQSFENKYVGLLYLLYQLLVEGGRLGPIQDGCQPQC